MRYQVDPFLSRAPRAFHGDENLWKDELSRIYDLIERHIDRIRDLDAEASSREMDDMPHLSIAIFGPSGSGKSSLLRTLAADTGKNKEAICPESLRIESLRVIDPTTWSEKDQFLYSFLASALEEEHSRRKQKRSGEPQGLSPVQLAFQNVNEYLRVIDEPGHSEEHDPLGLSLEKLERHTSGIRLKDALASFIQQLSDGFSADAVILPVDDLDMAPNHLVTALQTYQSFLTHPRLIPIFSFTDRMPEELIEVHFDRLLADVRQRPRREGEAGHLSISEQMAVQFLARSFPVRNRIRLGPAPARVQRAFLQTSKPSRSGESEEAREAKSVLELLTISSFLLFGHPDREDAHQIRAALRPSTLRRQLQVVDAMRVSHLRIFQTPQLAKMADPELNDPERLDILAYARLLKDGEKEEARKTLADWLKGKRALWRLWRPSLAQEREKGLLKVNTSASRGYFRLAKELQGISSNEGWATIFDRAVWSLLNVHRDTLRELGLFLENLYGWNPKELRSVVLDRILTQDRTMRRKVVDRWFNRTDYRRSQVLSLLAANVFRPWMRWEEPYGDNEEAVLAQQKREKEQAQGGDSEVTTKGKSLESESSEQAVPFVQERVMFPATQGLLWFLNVTLGFYLPQIMARDWTEALSSDEPLKGWMSGNGWDLRNAPINAMRIADVRQEIFSFGMVFLDPFGYRCAIDEDDPDLLLEKLDEDLEEMKNLRQRRAGRKGALAHRLKEQVESSEGYEAAKRDLKEIEARLGFLSEKLKCLSERRNHLETCREDQKIGTDVICQKQRRARLLLRIWSCYGYSRGRYWAAFSLWRGLGFIGQALEVGLRFRDDLDSLLETKPVRESQSGKWNTVLAGKAVSSLQGEDWGKRLKKDLTRLIRAHCLSGLVPGSFLDRNSEEKRMLHGFPRWEPTDKDVAGAIDGLADDLILWLLRCWADQIVPLPAGDAWIGWRDCFLRRIHGEYILGGLWPRLNGAYLEEHDSEPCCRALAWERSKREHGRFGWPEQEGKYRWTAALAAGAWSDILLEYWRGCPPILHLLLTCPAFFKNPERFGPRDADGRSVNPAHVLEQLKKNAEKSEEEEKPEFTKSKAALQEPRYRWLKRLALPNACWSELRKLWTDGHPPDSELTPDALCIGRVALEDFAVQPFERHSIRLEPTKISVCEGEDLKTKAEIYAASTPRHEDGCPGSGEQG